MNLKEKLRIIFNNEDPIGIFFPGLNNLDEYDSEIDKILPVVRIIKSEDELHELIWNVFKEMFDEEIAGPKEHYATISKKVWDLREDK